MNEKLKKETPIPSRLRGRGVEVSKTLFYKVLRPKQQQAGEPEDDYGEEDYEDDGPPWDEDEENSEEDEE